MKTLFNEAIAKITNNRICLAEKAWAARSRTVEELVLEVYPLCKQLVSEVSGVAVEKFDEVTLAFEDKCVTDTETTGTAARCSANMTRNIVSCVGTYVGSTITVYRGAKMFHKKMPIVMLRSLVTFVMCHELWHVVDHMSNAFNVNSLFRIDIFDSLECFTDIRAYITMRKLVSGTRLLNSELLRVIELREKWIADALKASKDDARWYENSELCGNIGAQRYWLRSGLA